MNQLAGQSPQGSPQSSGRPGQSGQKGSPANLSPEMLDDFKKASDEQLAKLGATEQSAREEIQEPLADMGLMQEIIKDINRFKELYAAQKEIAEQSRAYGRPGLLSREDQLALKDLAGREQSIGQELDAVEQKLWEDGKAAMEKFPKAGQSAQDLARRMGDLRLQMHANRAVSAMLEGRGDQSANLAENLRAEMEKLFSECNGKGGEMNDELDQYLTIQRSMNPGNSFKQMMQTRKFANGRGFKPGQGMQGSGGSDGYAVITGPNANVMGNETMIGESDRAMMDGNGKNKAVPAAAGAQATIDKADVVQGMEAINRESGAVQGELGIEQYTDIVDRYFKALTKPAAKPQGKQP